MRRPGEPLWLHRSKQDRGVGRPRQPARSVAADGDKTASGVSVGKAGTSVGGAGPATVAVGMTGGVAVTVAVGVSVGIAVGVSVGIAVGVSVGASAGDTPLPHVSASARQPRAVADPGVWKRKRR